MLRSITPDQKEILFPFVSKVTESYLNNEKIDHDAFTGYQNKFFGSNADFFKRLSGISQQPLVIRSILGKAFADLGHALKENRTPYICGGESEVIFSKDFPNDAQFVFSEKEKQKIDQTRKMLDNDTDGVTYYEKLNTVPRERIFGGKYSYVRYHLFILEKNTEAQNRIDSKF